MRINFKRASFMGVMITLAMMILVGFTPLKASAKGDCIGVEDVLEVKQGKTVTIDGAPFNNANRRNKNDYFEYKLSNGKKIKIKLKNIKFKVKNKKIASYDKKKFTVKGLKTGYTTLNARYNGNNITIEVHVLCKKHDYETKTVNPEPGKPGYTAKICKKCHHVKDKKVLEYKWTREEVLQRIKDFINTYPNYAHVTDSLFDETNYMWMGFQKTHYCSAYAGYVQDWVFGIDTSYTTHSDLSKVKPGDVIWMHDANHAFFIIDVNDKGYVYAINDCAYYWPGVRIDGSCNYAFCEDNKVYKIANARTMHHPELWKVASSDFTIYTRY